MLMTLVKANLSCPKNQSRYLYAKRDPTMMIANPKTLNVMLIFIFFCEKIVFMIRIRTYTNNILVMIGRTIFTMKRIND